MWNELLFILFCCIKAYSSTSRLSSPLLKTSRCLYVCWGNPSKQSQLHRSFTLIFSMNPPLGLRHFLGLPCYYQHRLCTRNNLQYNEGWRQNRDFYLAQTTDKKRWQTFLGYFPSWQPLNCFLRVQILKKRQITNTWEASRWKTESPATLWGRICPIACQRQ